MHSPLLRSTQSLQKLTKLMFMSGGSLLAKSDSMNYYSKRIHTK